jgi:predicted chitinase
MIAVYREQLRLLCPSTAIPRYLFRNMEEVLFDYCIADSAQRLTHFFAHVLHETSGLTSLVDTLDYSAEQIAARWPRRFANAREAVPYAHNPIALANRSTGASWATATWATAGGSTAAACCASPAARCTSASASAWTSIWWRIRTW